MGWLARLFGKKRKRTLLNREQIISMSEDIKTYDREQIMGWYDVSQSVYYSVKNGTHRLLK